jgi:phosphate transport system substrate-binding protein
MALRDGQIDLGLISRALDANESLGLVVTPYAVSPLALAVHEDVPERALTSRALAAIYRGETTTWSDGSRAVPLLREPGDSGDLLVREQLPEVWAAIEDARRAGRGLVLYTDQEAESALSSVPGAVGFVDLGLVVAGAPATSRPSVVALDGIHPGDAVWPLSRPLAFVTAGPPRGQVADFIALSLSPAATKIFRAHGCVPESGPP